MKIWYIELQYNISNIRLSVSLAPFMNVYTRDLHRFHSIPFLGIFHILVAPFRFSPYFHSPQKGRNYRNNTKKSKVFEMVIFKDALEETVPLKISVSDKTGIVVAS